MRFVVATVAATLTFALLLNSGEFRAEEKDKDAPKYKIKEVMKLAHLKAKKTDETLLEKVVAGSATKEEKQKLAELYVSLSQNKPPKGEAEDWKAVTAKIVVQAQAAAKGEEGAPKLLKEATNCGGCHSKFKAPKKAG